MSIDPNSWAASTPLANAFYNPLQAQQQGNKGAGAGLNYYSGMSAPQYGSMMMQGPQYAGAISANPVQSNAYNNISTNPQYVGAQQAQLSALQGLAQNGGWTPQQTANLQQIQNQQNQNANSQRGAVLQQAQMRGALTGGNAMVSQQMANQAAQNQANQQGLGVMGQASQNALQASNMAGQLGGQMQGQQWGEQAQQAAAQNAINQFNSQNATQTGMFNNAQQQGVNNAAAQAQNQNQYYNNLAIPGQTFANQMQIGQGMTQAGLGQAGYLNNQQQIAGSQQNNIWGQAAGIGGQAYNGIAGMLGSGGGEAAAGGMGDETAGGFAGGDMADAGAGLFAAHGGKIPPLGSGGRFANLEHKLEGEGHSKESSDAIAASVGRAKYGNKGMSNLSHKGHLAGGGKLPGQASVPGDSYANDKVPILGSPGEVMVPRSIANSGDSGKIAGFVKNPPMAKIGANSGNGNLAAQSANPAKDKEAMLSALKHIRQKGGAF